MNMSGIEDYDLAVLGSGAGDKWKGSGSSAGSVQDLDRHHFLPSQPALHPDLPRGSRDRSTSGGGA